MSSRSVSIEADGLGFNASRQLPRISVRVGGQIIQALVDTGASVNFIRPDLFPNKDFSSLPNATFIQLGCQNSTSRSLGHLEVPMEIEGQEYVVKATLLSKLNEKFGGTRRSPPNGVGTFTRSWVVAVATKVQFGQKELKYLGRVVSAQSKPQEGLCSEYAGLPDSEVDSSTKRVLRNSRMAERIYSPLLRSGRSSDGHDRQEPKI
ncbi:hypothetical protein JTB14_015678 [Gonioctena quinquepunctata]|nr:hypothetical protein JTB14_015678 [Gonioctena quinquepunctata]